MKFRWTESLGLVTGWRRGAKQGDDPYAPLRLYQFTIKDYVRFDLQSSQDGGTWKTQLCGR